MLSYPWRSMKPIARKSMCTNLKPGFGNSGFPGRPATRITILKNQFSWSKNYDNRRIPDGPDRQSALRCHVRTARFGRAGGGTDPGIAHCKPTVLQPRTDYYLRYFGAALRRHWKIY